MITIVKVIIVVTLYFVFMKVTSKSNLQYKSGYRKLLNSVLKTESTRISISLFVVHTFKLCLIGLSLSLVPYIDESIPILQNFDASFYLACLILHSMTEYFISAISTANENDEENRYAIITLVYMLPQFGMIYLYGTSSFNEIVVGQKISQDFYLVNYGIFRNPLLFIASFVLIQSYYQSLLKYNQENANDSTNPIGLLTRELVYISFCLLLCFMYLGGDSLPFFEGAISKYSSELYLFTKPLVLIIKVYMIMWVVGKVSRKLVYRSEYFQSKLMMTMLTPIIFLGLVIMPLIQFWRQV